MAVDCTLALSDHNRAQAETRHLHIVLNLASCQVFGKQGDLRLKLLHSSEVPTWAVVQSHSRSEAKDGCTVGSWWGFFAGFHSDAVYACGYVTHFVMCCMVSATRFVQSIMRGVSWAYVDFYANMEWSSHMLELFWTYFIAIVKWTGVITDANPHLLAEVKHMQIFFCTFFYVEFRKWLDQAW